MPVYLKIEIKCDLDFLNKQKEKLRQLVGCSTILKLQAATPTPRPVFENGVFLFTPVVWQ
jgi:hypothetical protein